MRLATWADAPTTLRAALIWITATSLTLVAILLVPGKTFIGLYAQDILGFADGAYRVGEGRIPNVDFPNILGPLAILFPAAGLFLGGSFGAMFPVATALATICIAPLLYYVVVSRLPNLFAVVFVVFTLILLVAPLNPGDFTRLTSMSFAMFYNRWAWALTGLLMLFALPRQRGTGSADALIMAAILLFLFYLKVTFFVVCLAFVILFGVDRKFRGNSLLAVEVTVAEILCVEIIWGGHRWLPARFARCSGVVRRSSRGGRPVRDDPPSKH